MPAPRQSSKGSSLPTIIPKRIDNTLSLDKYYRSAHLLVRQAGEYRAQHDEYQLWVMLMRLCSLIVETIPNHKDYNKNAPLHRTFEYDVKHKYFKELENLKINLKTQLEHDQDGDNESLGMDSYHSRAAPNAVQLSTSSLPQLDWGPMPSRGSGIGNASNPSSPDPFDVELLGRFSNLSTSASQDSGTQPIIARLNSANSMPGDLGLPTFSSSIKPVSQEARDRHALMPSIAPIVRRPSSSGGPVTSYPAFDTSPWKAIDYRIATSSSAENSGLPDVLPSAPPLSVPVQNGHGAQSLMDLDAAPRPSPMLGPQEIQVHSLERPTGPLDPNGTCNHAAPSPPPPPPPPPPEDQPGEVKRIKGLREVHVSIAVMENFLGIAAHNTKRNTEFCGILAGKLDAQEGIFRLDTLIIPKQQGTSDTVQALAEEEIFEAQDKRGLFPMGWIHTHPSQSCFLSSIDVHTQCGYQTMLDEAIAIVMAPTCLQQKCGVFRLSTPEGLKLIQKCSLRGFHHHPNPNGVPIYEISGHVFLNERIEHQVIDLR